MSLLIINNAGFIKTGINYYISRTTGIFISNLKKNSTDKITLLQFVENCNIEEGINDFKVSDDFNIQSFPFYHGYKKIVGYLIATFKVFKKIRKTNDFIYIFYPGHLSLIIGYVCVIFNKSYGLYVRGEYKLPISIPIFKNAKFINTVGIVFQKEIKKINNNCKLVRPMVHFNFFEKPDYRNVSKADEIMFVGRIEKRKGVWEIVKAARKIEKNHPNYTFRLIGAGQDSDEIKKYIENNSITNVILQGAVFNQDELKQYYMQSKMFLFPSYDEGFPRVLYEAMYFKIPIITTFVGNIPGIMQNNYNCLKIENRSVDSIVLHVDKLINDTNLAKKLAENGEKTLSFIFNDEIIDHSSLLMKQLNDYDK